MVGKRKGGVKSGDWKGMEYDSVAGDKRQLTTYADSTAQQHHRGLSSRLETRPRANEICRFRFALRPDPSVAPPFFFPIHNFGSFPRPQSHEIHSKPLFILKQAPHPSPSHNFRRHIPSSLVLFSPPLSRSPKFPWHAPCLFGCS